MTISLPPWPWMPATTWSELDNHRSAGGRLGHSIRRPPAARPYRVAFTQYETLPAVAPVGFRTGFCPDPHRRSRPTGGQGPRPRLLDDRRPGRPRHIRPVCIPHQRRISGGSGEPASSTRPTAWRMRLSNPAAIPMQPGPGDSRACFYRIDVDTPPLTSAPQPVPISMDRHWRLCVDASDSTIGSVVPRLELGYRPHDLFFVARGSGPFTLAFGSAAVEPLKVNVAAPLRRYRPASRKWNPAVG